MNSDRARRNAARPTNPACMRQLLVDEAPCDCGQPALVRVPKEDGTGGYYSLCHVCATGFVPFTRDMAVLELEEMLALLEDLD